MPDSRIEDLFNEAAALDPEARADFLHRHCTHEERRQVEKLLEVETEAAKYFDDLAGEISAHGERELAHASARAVEIGPYRTVGLLGTGGMGVVYRARRIDGEFEKEVALKLLHLDMLADGSRRRFLTERQILAQLEHPGIARLLDGGVTDEGRPFFVMELVDGVPIDAHCRAQQLTLLETLNLFRELVDAVAYLHASFVVHRDLKPSNVLVDRTGRVRLLDFGIAKLLDNEPGDTRLTITGQRLLTPDYAAPEQLHGGRITTATDVYGLGVVLYQLLTGRLPRTGGLEGVTATYETIVAPGAALVSEARDETSPSLPWRRIDTDLDTICLEALRPEPERRYATAEQLGQDIDRYLEGHPIRARPATLGYRGARFLRRHRTGVALAAIALLLVVAGFTRERSLRRQAQIEAAKTATVAAVLGDLIASVDPENARGREITVLEVIDGASESLAGDSFAGQSAVEADVRLVLGRTYSSLSRWEQAQGEFERVLQLSGDETLSSANETGLQAAEELGVLLRTDDPQRAQTLLRELLEVRRERHGSDDARTLAAMASLSRALSAPEDMGEAEALDRHVLAARRQQLGAGHPDTIRAMNTLAGTLFVTQRFEEAAQMYSEGYVLARNDLGADHPDTLRLAMNLAATQSVLGRLEEAEAMHREVLASRLRILGDQHGDVGWSLHNLGIVLLQQARYEEAAATFRRAAPKRSDSGRLLSQGYLADALRELGHLAEAETIYLDTLVEQQELFERAEPDLYRTFVGLAELRLVEGEPAAAHELAGEALEGYTAIHGEAHPSIATSLELMARAELDRGNTDEAVRLVGRAVEIAESTLPEGHPDLLDTRLSQARLLLFANQAEAALEGLPELVEQRLDQLGPDHPASRDVLTLAANISDAVDLPEEAAGYRSRLQ